MHAGTDNPCTRPNECVRIRSATDAGDESDEPNSTERN